MPRLPGDPGGGPTVKPRPKRTPPPKRNAPQHVQSPPGGDIASSGGDYGTRKAKRYTAKAAFRQSVRQVYEAQPTKTRSKIAHSGAPGPAARAIRHEHAARIARNKEIAYGQSQHDVPGADLGRANRYLASHPYILNPKREEPTRKPSGLGFSPDLSHLPLGATIAKLTPAVGGATAGAAALLLERGSEFGKAIRDINVPDKGVGGYLATTAKNFPADYLETYGEAVPSTIHLGQTAVEKGPEEAGKELLQFPKALYHDPLETIKEHPYASVAVAKGLKGLAGHTLGVGMRGIPGPTRDLASKAKAPKVREGTGLVEQQRYSGDVFAKASEVARERLAAKSSTVAKVVPKRLKPGNVMTDSQVQKRVDEFFGAHEDVRRANVAEAVRTTHKTVGKKATPGQVLAAQNIIAPTKDGLRAERDRLVGEQKGLDGVKLSQNRDTVQRIDEELRNWDPAKYRNLENYKAYNAAQQQQLGALYGQEARVESANLRPYAVKWMDGREVDGKFVDPHGVELTPDRIRAHMASEEGPGVVSDPAFVSHAMNRSISGAYFKTSAEAHSMTPMSASGRSGEAARQGSFDASQGVLEENAARSASLITSAQSFDRFLQEFGYRHQDKLVQVKSYKDAQNIASEWNNTHPQQQVAPIRVHPFGAGGEQLHALMDRVSTGEINAEEAHGAIRDSLEQAGQDEGPFALVPSSAKSQAAAHMARQVGNVFDSIAHLYGGQFRKVVLALSPKWFTGNVVEAALRTVIAGAGPRSFYTGYRALKKSGLEGFDRKIALSRMVGGGHGHMQGNIQVRASAEQLRKVGAGETLGAFADFLARRRKNFGIHHAATGFNLWSNFVFQTLNGNIESFFQTGMLGKALRDSPLMDGRTLKTSRAAIDDAAKGLTNTNAQVALGRSIDRMFGQYGKFSPGTRRMIALYTPFIAWTFNAIRFTTRVLPKDHPVITAITADIQVAEAEWRKEHGLGAFMDKHVPDFLLGSFPTGGTGAAPGGSNRISRYTPFGFWGDPLGNLSSTVLPQVRTVVNAAAGKDFKGDDLPGIGGPNDYYIRGVAMALAIAESSIPVAGQAGRIFTQPTGSNWTGIEAKHGPIGERLNKEFNPFAATKPRSSSKSGSSKPTNPFKNTPTSSGSPFKVSRGTAANPFK